MMVGNRVLMKGNAKVGLVMEQFIRLAVHCGMPAEDINFLSCGRRDFEDLADKCGLRVL